MIYWVFYASMLIGFGGVTWYAPDLKSRLIGFLLLIVNGILFWK